MNTPVTEKEMANFKLSDNIHIGGKSFAFNNADGSAEFHPNRRERRAYKNQPSGNNRKTTNGRRTITLLNKDSSKIKTQFKTHL